MLEQVAEHLLALTAATRERTIEETKNSAKIYDFQSRCIIAQLLTDAKFSKTEIMAFLGQNRENYYNLSKQHKQFLKDSLSYHYAFYLIESNFLKYLKESFIPEAC